MTEYSPQWKEKVQPGSHVVRDMDYFQGMYPQRIKEIQRYVIYQCDAMDYSGSPIYDEFPDVLMIEQACRAVCQMIPQNRITGEASEGEWTQEDTDVEETYAAQDIEAIQSRPGGPPPGGRPPGGPPPGGRPPGGPPPWGPSPGGRPPGGPPPWGPPPGGRPPGGPPPWGPPPGSRPPGGPPPWGPPPGSRPPSPPPPRDNWLADIVKVLFMNEIQRRRCHMGRC